MISEMYCSFIGELLLSSGAGTSVLTVTDYITVINYLTIGKHWKGGDAESSDRLIKHLRRGNVNDSQGRIV